MDQETQGEGNSNGDWISFLLALAISQLPTGTIDIDVGIWARTISLLLTGLLILSSLAQVMRGLTRILRLTSKSVGAGFLLLSLGQLFVCPHGLEISLTIGDICHFAPGATAHIPPSIARTRYGSVLTLLLQLDHHRFRRDLCVLPTRPGYTAAIFFARL